MATVAVDDSSGRAAAERSPARHDFQTIQALRAVAALVVVVFHALEAWQQRIDASAFRWPNGSAGVDIFFVISGFVMLISSRRLARRSDGWREFLRRRIIRIVPLYWLITTVKLLGNLAFPEQSLHGAITPYHVIASYLFVPSYDGSGDIAPVLPVGWTLSYEMLFYVLFALALFLKANVLKVLVPILGVLALISPFRTESWPAVTDLANTLELEFVAGVCLAMLVLQGRRLGEAWAWLLLGAGFVAIAVLPEGGRDLRVVTWGLPALAIVAAAVSLEERLLGHLPRWLLFLGDASYAIYLVHFLVTSGSAVLFAKFEVNDAAFQPVMVVFCLAASAILGGAIHVLIERPLTDWLKRVGSAPKDSQIAAPTARPASLRLASDQSRQI